MNEGPGHPAGSSTSPSIYRIDIMSKWLLSIALLVIASSAGVTYVQRSGSAARDLEGRQAAQTKQLTRITRELALVRTELLASQKDLASYAEGRAAMAPLQARLSELESELLSTRSDVEDQTTAIADVGKRQDEWVRSELDKQLLEVTRDIEARWNSVSQTLEATVQIAERNRESFDNLRQSVDQAEHETRDVNALWSDLMGPTVQISDDSTVGSGVLLLSRESKPGEYETYLLTAWHVIRDILGEARDFEQKIQVFIYHEDGPRTMEWAKLVDYDARLDSALLLMVSSAKHEHGAQLPSREHLDGLSVFDSIYAVGCPLGNDPIPTRGEIADTNHHVDGDHYWMINAPTYIGNSGGGIFDSQTHELLGIFSKIYTHGNLRPTVVPHMGLVTPLSEIYDWLEDVGQGHILPK